MQNVWPVSLGYGVLFNFQHFEKRPSNVQKVIVEVVQ